jgi:hypothetical protein
MYSVFIHHGTVDREKVLVSSSLCALTQNIKFTVTLYPESRWLAQILTEYNALCDILVSLSSCYAGDCRSYFVFLLPEQHTGLPYLPTLSISVL